MLMSVRVADAVLAFAPGAQDTMMVLALALHLDPVFVGALHLSRFLLVSMLVPFLAHRLRSATAAEARARRRRARPSGGPGQTLDGIASIPPRADAAFSGRPSSSHTSTSASASASISPSS